MARRHELTDEQWSRIQPLLPPERGRGCRPSKPHRRILNGIIWILKTGAPWRDLPRRYGPWKTVHTRFLRWSKQGVLQRIFDDVSVDSDNELTILDGSYVRVHQDAVGGKKTDQRLLDDHAEDQRPRFMQPSTPSEIQRTSKSQRARFTTSSLRQESSKTVNRRRSSGTKATMPMR